LRFGREGGIRYYTSPSGRGVKEHRAMVAIAAILIFIVAIGALNWFEFGRID